MQSEVLRYFGSFDSFPTDAHRATVEREHTRPKTCPSWVQLVSVTMSATPSSATPSTLPTGPIPVACFERQTNLYAPATYITALAGVAITAVAAVANPIVGLFVAALLCGWAEVDGLCGTSHVGALTPLRALDKTHRLWLGATCAYTVGGVVTASLVGLTLGLVGTATGVGLPPPIPFALISTAALILAVRELGLIKFALPQIHRQTDKMWALRFGFVTGAAMWGSHIGLGFATVIKHGGLFIVAASALLLDPLQSALLLATFWIGRTLPIWATPLLTSNEADGSAVTDLLLARPSAYRICAFAGLVGFGLAAAMLGMHSL